MSLRSWFGAMLLMLGGTACGPMPGYQMPHGEAPPSPRTPPTPSPDEEEEEERQELVHRDDERYGQEDRDGREEPGAGVDDEAPGAEREADAPAPAPEPKAPRPPRYAPPKNWDEPKPETEPRKSPTPAPEPTTPEPPDAVRIVRLDADSYYLIDPVRRLCFLRHKESMTAIDCTKIPEAGTPGRDRESEGSPRPASPPAEELTRFEAAFTAIYCDRKSGVDTLPETRMREHGLTTARYEAIEAWWAGDENAWYTLTTRAAKACPR